MFGANKCPVLETGEIFRRDTVDVQNLSISTGLTGDLPYRCCIVMVYLTASKRHWIMLEQEDSHRESQCCHRVSLCTGILLLARMSSCGTEWQSRVGDHHQLKSVIHCLAPTLLTCKNVRVCLSGNSVNSLWTVKDNSNKNAGCRSIQRLTSVRSPFCVG